jgi:pimeloyl-ACP methyl ester carboxylesterase
MLKAAVVTSLLILSVAGNAQAKALSNAAPRYHDPIPRRTMMIPVQQGVKLEVLDWGGTGRPVVLLAGLGFTAHIFDGLAPILAKKYHVYGITRRGYGNSSRPKAGYDVARLGKDVIAVIDALHLRKPVLVGHSIAGEELSWIANNDPKAVGGLVYLDAGYDYAFYNAHAQTLALDVPKLEADLKKDEAKPSIGTIHRILDVDLPRIETELGRQKEGISLGPEEANHPPTPTEVESVANMEQYASYMTGTPLPIAELHQILKVRANGSVAGMRSDGGAGRKILHGTEKFTRIPDPVLAIYACPHQLTAAAAQETTKELAERAALDKASCKEQADALHAAVPGSKVLMWPNQVHMFFLTHPDRVADAIETFVSGLPKS